MIGLAKRQPLLDYLNNNLNSHSTGTSAGAPIVLDQEHQDAPGGIASFAGSYSTLEGAMRNVATVAGIADGNDQSGLHAQGSGRVSDLSSREFCRNALMQQGRFFP